MKNTNIQAQQETENKSQREESRLNSIGNSECISNLMIIFF
jgi:hypothetical protein